MPVVTVQTMGVLVGTGCAVAVGIVDPLSCFAFADIAIKPASATITSILSIFLLISFFLSDKQIRRVSLIYVS
jgi:hypothetical protein